MAKIIGPELKNMPWQDRPEGHFMPVWRYDANPIIGRHDIPRANSIFNSAVVPYKGEFAGVFRCDDRTGHMDLYVGHSKDGVKWEISNDPIVMYNEKGEVVPYEYRYDPRVLFMDEPLSNLDAKLRNQMRAEIILLRQKLDTTFIYVTHDQTEAMTLGDRIVIMKDGFIQQVGTPQEVFDTPQNLFVAGFIGAPQMNFIPSKLVKKGEGYDVDVLLTYAEGEDLLSIKKWAEELMRQGQSVQVQREIPEKLRYKRLI